jgi:small subunit ribosomal protein S17
MTRATTGEQKDVRGKILRGVVVSNKAKDTITVLVTRYVKHPKYQKYQKLTKKYLAHDPGNTRELGQAVSIRETRPISKRKSFIVV